MSIDKELQIDFTAARANEFVKRQADRANLVIADIRGFPSLNY